MEDDPAYSKDEDDRTTLHLHSTNQSSKHYQAVTPLISHNASLKYKNPLNSTI